MTDALKISKADGILEVVIDRPKANAIDNPTSRELGQLFLDFLKDDSLRVAILSGAGERFFSAGWDLKAAAEGEAVDSDYGPGGFGGITELTQRDKPIIAAINGNAIGGGVDIMVSADLAVAADHAQFWTPEVKVGVIADATAIRLPKRIPRAVALEMLLTGRRMDAEEALRFGLVNRVVPGAGLMETAREMARDIVEAAPLAVAATMEAFRHGETTSLADCYAAMKSRAWPAHAAMVDSEDAVEGPLAFAEKRAPVWKGR